MEPRHRRRETERREEGKEVVLKCLADEMLSRAARGALEFTHIRNISAALAPLPLDRLHCESGKRKEEKRVKMCWQKSAVNVREAESVGEQGRKEPVREHECRRRASRAELRVGVKVAVLRLRHDIQN